MDKERVTCIDCEEEYNAGQCIALLVGNGHIWGYRCEKCHEKAIQEEE
jgi:hypothetical protein